MDEQTQELIRRVSALETRIKATEESLIELQKSILAEKPYPFLSGSISVIINHLKD